MSIAAPAGAADWSDDWDGGGDLRGSYINEPKDWSGLGDENDPLTFEFGVRYWYSWGAQSASSGGASVSATDNSHIGEAHLRIEDHATNFYVKGWAGYAAVINGTVAAPLNTISDGTIAYAGGDVGWNVFGSEGSGLGFLAGYQYWNDSPDTGRFNYTTATSASDITYDPVTGQTFVPGNSAPNRLNAHMLRLGIQGKANFNNFIDFSAEIAAVPYAKVGGQIGIDDVTFDPSVYGGAAPPPHRRNFRNIDLLWPPPPGPPGWGLRRPAGARVRHPPPPENGAPRRRPPLVPAGHRGRDLHRGQHRQPERVRRPGHGLRYRSDVQQRRLHHHQQPVLHAALRPHGRADLRFLTSFLSRLVRLPREG